MSLSIKNHLIEGADYLAQKILNMPVRLGVPNQISGLEELVSKPECATGVGLLVWGSKNASTSKNQKIIQQKNKRMVSYYM